MDILDPLYTVLTTPIVTIWAVLSSWWFWAAAAVLTVALHRLWLPEFLQAVRGAGSNDQAGEQRKGQS